jgi:hypothetical protein
VPRTNVEQSSPPTVRAPTSPPACTQMLQHNLSRYIQLVPFEFLTASGLKSAGRKAVAAQGLAPGTVINHFFEPVLTRPTMHTICLGEHYHVAPTQGAGAFVCVCVSAPTLTPSPRSEFISHACEGSNTRILVGAPQQGGKVVVTRPVAQGEDLSFNYNTTEWIMSCPFDCACASCTLSPSKRQVRGFAFLSPSERMKIYHETTPWIRSLAARSQSHTVASKHPSSAVSEQALQQQQQQ